VGENPRKLHDLDAYTIIASDQKTQAIIIPERGAWVASLVLPFKNGSREILFQHNYAWDKTLNDLAGGVPFLFPICARIARNNQDGVYLYDGKQYELKIHGFSWYEKWTVGEVTGNAIEMILRDNQNTLLHYPFHFEVRLKYEVLPGKLLCHQFYKNNESVRAMPYYAGFHPYFLTPPENDGKEKVSLHFESTRRLKYNDTMTDIVDELPVLKTPISISSPDINEQLSVLGKNKSATLTFPDGDVIKIDMIENSDYFPYLQLYTIPEKPFFCVERWMGFPNALNTVSGVRWLKAGMSESAVYEVSSTL